MKTKEEVLNLVRDCLTEGITIDCNTTGRGETGAFDVVIMPGDSWDVVCDKLQKAFLKGVSPITVINNFIVNQKPFKQGDLMGGEQGITIGGKEIRTHIVDRDGKKHETEKTEKDVLILVDECLKNKVTIACLNYPVGMVGATADVIIRPQHSWNEIFNNLYNALEVKREAEKIHPVDIIRKHIDKILNPDN
jgi:hypothetical protein